MDDPIAEIVRLLADRTDLERMAARAAVVAQLYPRHKPARFGLRPAFARRFFSTMIYCLLIVICISGYSFGWIQSVSGHLLRHLAQLHDPLFLTTVTAAWTLVVVTPLQLTVMATWAAVRQMWTL